MSMTLDEQRALALECGMAVSQGGNGYWDNVRQLAAYTAAVEAKRDEEVAELKNRLAISQVLNIRMCGEGAPEELWEEVAQEELIALLAKEREKLIAHIEEQISRSDADDEMDICIMNTLETAVSQLRSLK